jgi:hypothetical protein
MLRRSCLPLTCKGSGFGRNASRLVRWESSIARSFYPCAERRSQYLEGPWRNLANLLQFGDDYVRGDAHDRRIRFPRSVGAAVAGKERRLASHLRRRKNVVEHIVRDEKDVRRLDSISNVEFSKRELKKFRRGFGLPGLIRPPAKFFIEPAVFPSRLRKCAQCERGRLAVSRR